MSEPAFETPTAAVLLIGNELLSGKIRDENGYHLAKVLRRRGIALLEMCTVADVLDDIGEALRRLVRRTPLVFTSGGVGPTHDDVTIEAISAATGRPPLRHASMEASLRRHYGPDITPAALKMADVPQGTVLLAEHGWPVLRLDLAAGGLPPAAGGGPDHATRIYILPGVPALLRAKVDALEGLADELPRARGWTLLTVHTSLDESALAQPLVDIARAHPRVEIGSYPRWSPDAHGRLRAQVRVTLEANGPHAAEAERAHAALLARLDPQTLIPEWPDAPEPAPTVDSREPGPPTGSGARSGD